MLNNLRQLNSTYQDMYATEVYQLVVESIPGPQFIQDFFGATKYNFNFFLKPTSILDKPSISIGSTLTGFTQNLSIACDGNQEGYSIVFRNYSIGLICPDQTTSDSNLTYFLNPFIKKDMDAILDNYDDHDLGSIVDYFVLSTDNSYMIVLHEYISILRLQQSLQFAANIYLKDPQGEVVALDQCITINEGPFQNSLLEIDIICFKEKYLLYSFTINMTKISNIVASAQSNPAIEFLEATPYELSGSVASLFTSKNSQVMFIGDLYFSLNTIMIENYNDRGYLNIYNGSKSGTYIQPTLLWSSLSFEQFANCDLLIYKVTRLAQLPDADLLTMFTIMQCDGGALFTAFTNISTGVNPIFSAGPSQPFSPAYPVQNVQLFWRNSTLFLFLLNQDLIQEYISTDNFSFTATNVYRLSSVCDITAELSIFRAGNYMFLYCYNSTSDSTMSDTMLVYNDQVNLVTVDSANFVNPIQQLSFPDVDSPSNLILTSYLPPDDPSVIKLAVSSTRSFMTQYSFNSSAILEWQEFEQYKKDGYYNTAFTVLLATQNILSTANTAVPFQITFFSVILNYLSWFSQNMSACIVVVCYLLATNVLIYTGFSRSKQQEESDKADGNFIHQYKRIMDNQGIKSFLLEDTASSPIHTNSNSLATAHMSMGLTLANAGTEPRVTRDQNFGFRLINY